MTPISPEKASSRSVAIYSHLTKLGTHSLLYSPAPESARNYAFIKRRMQSSLEQLYHSNPTESLRYHPYSGHKDLLLRTSFDNIEGRDMTLCAPLAQSAHPDQSNLSKLSPESRLTNSIPSPGYMDNKALVKSVLEAPEDLSRLGSSTTSRKRSSTPDTPSESSGQEQKRLRVENIVTSITQPSRSPKTDTTIESRNKRKAFRPQQHGAPDSSGEIDVLSDQEPEVKADPKNEDAEKELLRNQLKIMGEQLQKMQQRYQEMYEKKEMERYELMSRVLPAIQHSQIDFESYVKSLSSEINQTIKSAVAEAVEKSLTNNNQPMNPKPSPVSHNPNMNPAHSRERENGFPSTPQREREQNNNSALISSVAEHFKRSGPNLAQHMLANGLLPGALPPTSQAHLGNPFLGGIPGIYGGQSLNPSQFNPQQAGHMAAAIQQQLMENEMMDSYRGINANGDNKKRRTKVTDTRLSPRAQSLSSQRPETETPLLSQQNNHPPSQFPMLPGVLPGFPFHPGFMGVPSLLNVEGRRSPLSGGGSDGSDRGTLSPDLSAASMLPALPGQTVTLTPLHLRKAKLMFFYVRYPSSLLLKNYFCDVHFNKNNTAQLVKWFSNFREFYYIQMEKYARQALADGLSASQINMTTDSELYKILNLHYNRNNQIEVPNSFLDAVLTTLREFVKAVSCGKDREQSWKKPIYKIIARLDDQVPEYFKSQEWLEQLSD